MKESIIIVAGGSGSRMATTLHLNTPKQFLLIGGLPILMHTINCFYNYSNAIQIIVVLPQNHISYWQQLVAIHNFDIKHTIVAGGETRFHSVKNGLAKATGSLIGVHDGVRPFASKETITAAYLTASNKQTAVPCLDLKDSIRSVATNTNKAEDRANFKLVQTPQVFDASILKKGYEQAYKQDFTDDARVIEELGYSINLTKGNYENIKITTKEDLLFAEAILGDNSPS